MESNSNSDNINMSKSIPIGTIKQSSFEFYAYDSDEDINGPEEKSGKSGPPLKPQLPAPDHVPLKR